MPAFFFTTDSYIYGKIMANYTSGAPVHGNLTLKATIRPIKRLQYYGLNQNVEPVEKYFSFVSNKNLFEVIASIFVSICLNMCGVNFLLSDNLSTIHFHQYFVPLKDYMKSQREFSNHLFEIYTKYYYILNNHWQLN